MKKTQSIQKFTLMSSLGYLQLTKQSIWVQRYIKVSAFKFLRMYKAKLFSQKMVEDVNKNIVFTVFHGRCLSLHYPHKVLNLSTVARRVIFEDCILKKGMGRKTISSAKNKGTQKSGTICVEARRRNLFNTRLVPIFQSNNPASF